VYFLLGIGVRDRIARNVLVMWYHWVSILDGVTTVSMSYIDAGNIIGAIEHACGTHDTGSEFVEYLLLTWTMELFMVIWLTKGLQWGAPVLTEMVVSTSRSCAL
jgi:hypothetical protein